MENFKKKNKQAVAAYVKEDEREQLQFHSSVVLNITYWAIYERFHNAVLQLKNIDSKGNTNKEQVERSLLSIQIPSTWQEFQGLLCLNSAEEKKR